MAGRAWFERLRPSAVMLVASLALACPTSSERAPSRSTPTPEPLRFAVHGCHGLLRGQAPESALRCVVLGSTVELDLWLAPGSSDEASVELRLDGRALEIEVIERGEGTLVRVPLLTSSGSKSALELELERGTARGRVQIVRPSSDYAALRERTIERLEAAGPAAALELLDDGIARLEADDAALMRCLEAKLAMAGDELERVLELADDPSPRAIGCQGTLHLLAAYVTLVSRPDFRRAKRHIEAAGKAAELHFETAIGVRYYEALLDARLGRIDEALVAADASAQLAALARDRSQYASARVMQAVYLARLGRFADAEQLAHDVEAGLHELDDPRLALDIRANVAWIAVLRRDDDPHAPDPSPRLRELVGAYERLDERGDIASNRLNLALAAAQSGAFDEVRAELERLDPSELEPTQLVWHELISTRLAIADREFEAAESHLERAGLYADTLQDREFRWRVITTRAALARARGDRPAALAAYAEAAALASELALAIPITQGRSAFATSRSRTDAEHIELLLEADDARGAACVALAARSRAINALWSRIRPPLTPEREREYEDLLSRYEARRLAIDEAMREAWGLSRARLEALGERLAGDGERADELLARATALLEGELPRWTCEGALDRPASTGLLTMATAADAERGWLFLVRTERVVVVAVGDPEQPATSLREALAALAPELSRLDDLVVVASGPFIGVDIHRQLVELLPERTPVVRYSLGLGGSEPRGVSNRTASVVAGTKNLRAVADEVAAVRAALEQREFDVNATWSPTAATQPRILHYGGHGEHGGVLGWDSAIEVPGAGRLSAARLVAGQRAPEIVVLGACSAAAPSVEALDGGMNLAAAFVLAGADLVIAPLTTVSDEAALALARELYAGATELDADSLTRSLLTLQRRELARDPRLDERDSLTNWRVWVP